MPTNPNVPQIDQTRRECVLLVNQIRQRRTMRAQKLNELTQTHDLEERELLQRIIEGLDAEIEALQEELLFQDCYLRPTRPELFLKVIGVEATQSTQFFAPEGTGAGRDNSIQYVAGKPLLARAYLKSEFTEGVSVTGLLTLYQFNNNTLKYDIFRKAIEPSTFVWMPALASSRRRMFNESLNFTIPAGDCTGKLRLDIRAWVIGHEADPIYQATGVLAPVEFETKRTPIIHCFRISFTQTIPPVPPSMTPTSLALPVPSDADCRTTMDLAERMLPLAGLDIRDRGTRSLSGPLEVRADYDVVFNDIVSVRNGTTPTPGDHEIYVAMLPSHNNAARVRWGQAASRCIESIDGLSEMFAHELGHLLLPSDNDHVRDTACALNNLATDIDGNYPDYANTAQMSGIGEFGIDMGASPPRLFGPDIPEIMSYCGPPNWISPYNYMRAMVSDIVVPRSATAAASSAQKLLLSFRVHRDGKVELRQALHLPGEPRSFPGKSPTGIFVELYGQDNRLLASMECSHRNADRLKTAPYEDFNEVLPWNEEAMSAVIVREGREAARWQIEEPSEQLPVTDFTHRPVSREGAGLSFKVTWRNRTGAEPRYFMLRYTHDAGRTWTPVAAGSRETSVEVDASSLGGGEECRFQLAVSTGFRTSLTESSVFSVPHRARQVLIVHPKQQAEVANPVWLAGAASQASGEREPVHAFWNSNRDGFLGDGCRVLADKLSVGRHVLTLAMEDRSGGEIKDSVTVWVRPTLPENRATEVAGATGRACSD